MSSSDIQFNYGYLLSTVHLVRRETKSDASTQAIVEAITEIVFNKKLDEMLEEFNLNG